MTLRERFATLWRRYVVDDYGAIFGSEKPSLEETLASLDWNPSRVGEFYELGFISKEQARPYVIKHCREDNTAATHYLNAGLISSEEAREFLVNGCEM